MVGRCIALFSSRSVRSSTDKFTDSCTLKKRPSKEACWNPEERRSLSLRFRKWTRVTEFSPHCMSRTCVGSCESYVGSGRLDVHTHCQMPSAHVARVSGCPSGPGSIVTHLNSTTSALFVSRPHNCLSRRAKNHSCHVLVLQPCQPPTVRCGLLATLVKESDPDATRELDCDVFVVP